MTMETPQVVSNEVLVIPIGGAEGTSPTVADSVDRVTSENPNSNFNLAMEIHQEIFLDSSSITIH